MGYLPDKKTPVGADELVSALAKAYKKVTGQAASREKLALMVGQTALETGGAGGTLRSVHHYNIGNIRGEYDGNWTSFRAGEIEGGKEVFYEPSAANKFAAYPSLAKAAEHYVSKLKYRPHWWAGLQTETVVGFVKGLATKPVYMTASPTQYARILKERMDLYKTYIEKYSGAAVMGTGLVLLAGFGGTLLYRRFKKKRS